MRGSIPAPGSSYRCNKNNYVPKQKIKKQMVRQSMTHRKKKQNPIRRIIGNVQFLFEGTAFKNKKSCNGVTLVRGKIDYK
jgi:hypothetical protein